MPEFLPFRGIRYDLEKVGEASTRGRSAVRHPKRSRRGPAIPEGALTTSSASTWARLVMTASRSRRTGTSGRANSFAHGGLRVSSSTRASLPITS